MTTERAHHILVVDDNPATRYATSRVLRHAGFEVREASTGIAGVVTANDYPIDLVVLDIDLPDIDGYEVCRRIRSMASTRRVRVVYLSATFVDTKHKVEGFEAGADGFLTHPVEPAVLNATVASLLRTRAIEVELELLLDRERQAREEAERANRAKDDFLATLSHELRSPLTAIVGWAEVVRMKAEAHPEILSALQVIARNARLQAQLISDLLDVSRITAGNGLRLEMEPVLLADVVNSSIDSVTSTAAHREVVIERNVDATLMVFGDSGRLSQIAFNLLSNAIKFSNHGGVVHISLAAVNGNAELVVEDHGRGIGPQVLPRIFERFWQEDTTSRRSHGGLGIGLSIVKHLAEAHGGTVTATSDGEGKGSRFSFTIPLATRDVRVNHAVRSDAHAEISDDIVDLSGVRVLVVDDDADGREWVRHIVNAAGADTTDAGDVPSALEAVKTFKPHVIVSDLAMPQQNGFDLLIALREQGYSADTLPIIALSAFASAEDRRRALDADFQYFIAKPPDLQELLRLVQRAARSATRPATQG